MAVDDQLIVAAILVAAGSGERLGADVPKAFVTVAGRTLLEHCATRFVDHPEIHGVVVAAPAGLVEQAAELVPGARVVAGSVTRQQSVAVALTQIGEDVDVVLVHDVARAFVPSDLISRVIGAMRSDALAAVPTLPVTDTIRRVDPLTGELHETVDRSALLAMQTPQGFRREALVAAHARATGVDATDDAALVEAMGGRVITVRGDEQAFKITYAFDLVIAEAIAQGLINNPATRLASGRVAGVHD